MIMKRSNPRAMFYGKRQKKAAMHEENSASGDDAVDTDTALAFFRSMFNSAKFNDRVPPIIFKHQLYSVVNNRTQVDRDINRLQEKKEIKLFHFDDESENCLVFTEDYKKCLRSSEHCPHDITEKFISVLVDGSTDLTFNKTTMSSWGFQEKDITKLLHSGLLTVRDIGSWWLAIPGAGIFMKCYRKGRDAMLRTIRTSRRKEILMQELEGRKLQAVEPLGMKYHLYDILGAEHVIKIQTTSGVLLRYDM
ncbi:inactive serine/threonine-protein kinase 19-like isoform X1 [Apostichopus japonicus]|uniref:inactive serine/threonine-protein kinase 19-like isoform X1 n=2 Tax=Stichopus japonicus TaxID=307972 RepID=UPI003AB7DB5E